MGMAPSGRHPAATTRPGLGIGQATVRIGGQRVSGLPCKKAAASGWGPWKGRRLRPDLGLRGWSPQMNSGVAGFVPAIARRGPASVWCDGLGCTSPHAPAEIAAVEPAAAGKQWTKWSTSGSRSAVDDLVRIVSHCQRTASGLTSALDLAREVVEVEPAILFVGPAGQSCV
jgi:hypothetical protein